MTIALRRGQFIGDIWVPSGYAVVGLSRDVEALLAQGGDAAVLADAGLLTPAAAAASEACVDSFKIAYSFGDSLQGQHQVVGGGIHVVGAQGPFNWANQFVGAPFDFVNMGVSGAVGEDIFSRIWQMPPEVNTALVIAGTNSVNAVSGSADSVAIANAVAAMIGANGWLYRGLFALKAKRKQIGIATIPPNNAWVAGDSRVQVLDQVNAWIRSTPALGLADEVMDLFDVCWDSAQPTARVFKAGYFNTVDGTGTHLNNVAGFFGGLAFREPMKRLYLKATGRSTWTDLALNTLANYSAMRAVPNVQSQISTGGTGATGQLTGNQTAVDLASGWRALRGAGSPTWTCSIDDYAASVDYVGPMGQMVGVGEKWQRMLTTGAVANDVVRLQLNTPLAANQGLLGIDKGDAIMVGADCWVQNPAALGRVELTFTAFFGSGTAPADQAYGSSANTVRSHAGLTTSNPALAALPQGFRIFLRTTPVRIPENTTGPTGTALSGQFYMDSVFVGADNQADVRWGRPICWRKMF